MRFQPKRYQDLCLEALSKFLRRTAEPGVGAKTAFIERTERPYVTRGLPEPLRGLPYVCIRVPTGGGKTLLAAYSVGAAAREFLHLDRCVVLWFAPTNAIVEQTLRALRDRKHPYRQALDRDFGGAVEVLSITEALYVTRATLDGATTIIVSTLAAVRVEETEGRKIYETNGALEHHFSGLSDAQLAGLDRNDGVLAYSLANTLRLRCPLVLMDEAHNARTPLSFDALTRFAPSCIIEFTATPDQDANPSNVLYSVSAAELKAEEMVKLPIRMISRQQWKEAVGEAVTKQRQLERLASEEEKSTTEYIRPIVLLQAQPKREGQETITVEAIRKCLLEDFRIPREEIAEGTGHKWEIPDNLLSRDSVVRFVLTVAKLREGWDCPFAYILCSVSNLTSEVAVEQILGRVLRMPYAHAKQNDELNHAYAYATSERFVDAAKSLRDALIESGFERFEAQSFVEPERTLFDVPGLGPLFAQNLTESETLSKSPDLAKLPEQLRARLKVEPLPERPEVKITYAGPPITGEEERRLKLTLSDEEDQKAIERLVRKTRGQPVYPAALGESLSVPHLAVRARAQLEIFEDQFRDAPWSLAGCDAQLSQEEFSIAGPTGKEAVVDIDKAGKVQVEFVQELQRRLSFLDVRGPQTPSELADWLDRVIEHPDITQTQASLFLRRTVDHLLNERGIPFPDLVAARFRLRDAAKEKINKYRIQALTQSYQRMLLPDAATPLEVSPELCFQFPLNDYPANRYYQGGLKFKKHYYERAAEMNEEESQCAFLIDSLPQVEYWVRNLQQRPEHSFWLQTATDKFYPDFVARLSDGRSLVVEYKGADLMPLPDTIEKRTIGELWEARSAGKCIFRLVGLDGMERVLRQAIS